MIYAETLRIDVPADARTGLKQPSQIMIDKITVVDRRKVGSRIGALDAETLAAVDQALAAFLDLA